MNCMTIIQKRSLRALLLLPLLGALNTGPALAAPPEQAAAATTLDVCQNDATGNWRYSGVVSVRNGAATDTSVVRIGYFIQNRVSGIAYNDVYQADADADALLAARSGSAAARVVPFSIEAPPLVLGTLRNTSRVTIYDPLNAAAPAIYLQPSYDMNAAVCGCQHPKGCVRTQGYWSNKPGVVWPSPYHRYNNTFHSSGLNWQAIMDSPARGGNGYIILAHQYIAAVLNKAAGASVPASLQTVINNAAAYFASGATLDSCGANACETQKTWAGMLDSYNNGVYPSAPQSCPD